MGYAFISYSSKRMSEADALYRLLKKNQIDAWMAPGDIPGGMQYAEVISKAIRGCSCFILMLTRETQKSVWVAKETERAINYNKAVIPLKIDDIVLNDSFELYISSNQIIPIRQFNESSEQLLALLAAVKMYTGAPEKAENADTPAESEAGRTQDDYSGSIENILGEKYQLQRYEGTGRWGKIYTAVDSVSGEQRIVQAVDKRLNEHLTYKEQIYNQIKLFRRIRHPGIASIVEKIDSEHYLLIIKEYVKGTTLQRYMDQNQKEETVIRIGEEMCRITGYLHTQDPPIILRNLSVNDIMVCEDGTPILINLENAYERADDSVDNFEWGTHFYAAPESFNKKADVRSDIYSIGILLFVISSRKKKPLSRIVDFSFENLMMTYTFNPDFSDGLLQIIRKCCAFEPQERYQSTYDLLKALHELKNIPSSDSSVSLQEWNNEKPNLQEKPGLLARLKSHFRKK